jgi:hypothetical protein
MADRYYRWDLDGQHSGLVRRRADGQLAYAVKGEWVLDGSLLRAFIDPGTDWLDEVTEAEAEQVAASYDVALDGEPTRETALHDRVGIDD